ncbi:MAG: methyl-accepting chemotaxis protein [Acidobacteriaceae bacterium]
MNWFKNLDAAPRLMLSFGVLIVLIGIISSLAIFNLSRTNQRMEVLYKQDMTGLGVADDLVIARLMLGEQGRFTVLNIDDEARAGAHEKLILAELSGIHASLDQADKLFYLKEGKDLIANIHGALPAYEKSYLTLIERVNAHDGAGAEAATIQANMAGRPMFQSVDGLRLLKQSLGEKKYQANEEQYQIARSMLLSAAAIALLIGVVLSIFIARGFSAPLGEAVAALERVASGDLTTSVSVRSRDEVGRMAVALNAALKNVRSTLQAVSASAAQSGSSSQNLAGAAQAIASGAQQQAASLEETSASLEEITAAVRQSADNARQASQLAIGSRESAEQGQEVVLSAIAAMSEINTASAKISDIISTINEIAFQTNLLAVNAAVEAARAGEEGRGFAVVATEVRSLAQRSAEAAKEIKGLIQDSLQKVAKGSELVNRSGTTLQGIVASVKRVTDIVGEIAAASAEQSTGVDQVNTAITQMDQVTQSNSARTEQLSATAQSLAGESSRLLELVSTFTLGDSRQAARAERSHQPPRPGNRPVGDMPRPLSLAAYPASNGGKRRAEPAVLVGAPSARSEDASFEEF